VAQASTEDQLGWEARQRPRAAAAALAAALLTLVAAIGSAVVVNGAPLPGLLDSLSRAARPGPVGELPSLRIAQYEFIQERATALLGLGILQFLGYLGVAWALTFLAIATRARRPELPRAAIYIALAGGVLYALSVLFLAIGNSLSVGDALDGRRTVDATQESGASTVSLTGQILGIPGPLGLGLGFILVALNAMRCGLLTRFMGVLGIICGALVVLPIGSPLPVVQCFWLGALAVLLAGRWPSGNPPAWSTGRAEPWPSQSRRRPAPDAPAVADAPEQEPAAVAAGREHPASKKRKKRKKRPT